MIPFIDLQAQRLRLAGKIEAAVQEAVVGGAWVMVWAAPTAPTR
jgi:hypothetical protein